MSHRYIEWANGLSPELRKGISDPRGWFAALLVAALVLFLGGILPSTRPYLELGYRVPALLFLPPFLVGIVGGALERRRPLSPMVFGTVAVVDSAFFQLFAWSLVAYSKPPGSFMLAVFPVLLAAFHGQAYQASLRYPFQLVGTIAAALGGLLLTQDARHFVIFALAGPAAIMVAGMLGTLSMRQDAERRERDALRRALDAQMLKERAEEAQRYREMVLELRGQSHDAGNTLSSVLLNVETLLDAIDEQRGSPQPAQMSAVADDLKTALGRLSAILNEARAVGNRESLQRASVDVNEVLTTVLTDAQLRFPRVQLHPPANHGRPAPLLVYGGRTTLERVLSNLVVNACEGDGTNGAGHVWVECAIDEARGRYVFTVSDDGPGFDQQQLESALNVFQTTKPRGSGLGLYTTNSLVAANGGTLLRENRAEGGARVAVSLPSRSEA